MQQMAKIQFYHFSSKDTFESHLSQGRITSADIAFIDDTKEIWTHNRFYTGIRMGTSDEIPATANTGDIFYNTTDNIPLWFDGSVWRDSQGNIGSLKLVLATEAQIRAIFTEESIDGGGADPVFTSTHDGGNASTSDFEDELDGGNAAGI